jgi:transcriptional regulator of acetoin/glycerol metabolism
MVRVGGSDGIPLDVRILTATEPSIGSGRARPRAARRTSITRLAVSSSALPPLRRRGRRHRAPGEMRSSTSSTGRKGRRSGSTAARLAVGRRRTRGPATFASSRTASSAATCFRTTS